MKTVKDLKDQVLGEASVVDSSGFSNISLQHGELWKKMNRLGWDRRSKQPEDCDDVDATAGISDDEYDALVAEFRALGS